MASATLPLIAEETLSKLVPSGALDAVALAAVTVGSTAYLLRDIIWRDPYDHLWFNRPQLLENGGSAETSQSTRDVSKMIQELVSPKVSSIRIYNSIWLTNIDLIRTLML